MLWNRTIRLLIALLVLVFVMPAPAQDAGDGGNDFIMRIYDVRDLDAILPAERVNRPRSGGPQAPGATTSGGMGIGGGGGVGGGGRRGATAGGSQSGRGGAGGRAPGFARSTSGADAGVELVGRLCDARHVTWERLFDGVVAVEGTDDDHEMLMHEIEQVRRLYAERYEVCIALYTVPLDKAPDIGMRLETGDTVLETRQVVMGRQPTHIASTTSYMYVSGLVPIVGDGAMGYDAKTSTIDEGLELTLLVGAGRAPERHTAVRVTGEVSSVSLGRTSSSLWPGAGEPVTIDLPTTAARTIESSLVIPCEQLVTLAVVEGYEQGKVLALAIAVRKLDS